MVPYTDPSYLLRFGMTEPSWHPPQSHLNETVRYDWRPNGYFMGPVLPQKPYVEHDAGTGPPVFPGSAGFARVGHMTGFATTEGRP